MRIEATDVKAVIDRPEPTPENVLSVIEDLKEQLKGIGASLGTLPAVCVVLGMEPTKSSTRIVRRWYSTGKDFKQIPEITWRYLLIINHFGLRRIYEIRQ